MTSSATADPGAAEEVGGGLGADLLAVVARLNRYATQRIQMELPAAQARLLSTIDACGEARICDLAAVDHGSKLPAWSPVPSTPAMPGQSASGSPPKVCARSTASGSTAPP